jgi:hypothetical protein
MPSQDCYIVTSESQIPLHLRDRRPEVFPNTSIAFRQPESETLDDDGRVEVPNAIEMRTFITPGALAALCEPNELWTPELAEVTRFRAVYDPQIQRGEKETKSGVKTPILKEDNVASMMADIMTGDFECPELMWNLRFGETTWVYLRDARELRIYEGVATRPDTNHRHHAIIRAHKLFTKWQRETGSSAMERYNPARTYALAIYGDDFAGEAHKFFVLNSKGQKVAPGKAHFVSAMMNNPHIHSRLAHDLMNRSGIVSPKNVEIVQSTLSKNSTKLVLFYTLVRGLTDAFPAPPAADTPEYLELLQYLVDFVAGLSAARPDAIALLNLEQRQHIRATTIADQAITWIAYFKLAAELRHPSRSLGALNVLNVQYTFENFTGDFLARDNPLWQAKGILVPDGKGGYRVVSNRASQTNLTAALRERVLGVPAA